MSTSAGITNSSAEEEKEKALHCARCHQSFQASDNTHTSCEIEHDDDTFEGGRNGSQWYTGNLMCCGAYHKFHRHHSDGMKTDPENCFEGSHTTDPTQVQYNQYTIKICNVQECGEACFKASKEVYDEQQKVKLETKRKAEGDAAEEKRQTKARIGELHEQGKRREARQLRADMLGLDCDPDELNSDEDEDGCAEFDYADDSSLEPPW
jgi:hypothetical protein